MTRIAASTIAIALLLAALLSGCGSSSDVKTDSEARTGTVPGGAPIGARPKRCGKDVADAHGQLLATNVNCDTALKVVIAWNERGDPCTAKESRPACTVSGFRCIGAHTDRGMAVSCSQPGRSIAFIGRRSG